MRVSVGTDIIDIRRLPELMSRNVLQQMFTSSELDRGDVQHIAGRIALKEAAIKALHVTADYWHDIVIKQRDDKPYIDIRFDNADIESIDCSISHDGDYAVATVVVLYR
jgi:phosphopantetheine--protein transferase-like protein